MSRHRLTCLTIGLTIGLFLALLIPAVSWARNPFFGSGPSCQTVRIQNSTNGKIHYVVSWSPRLEGDLIAGASLNHTAGATAEFSSLIIQYFSPASERGNQGQSMTGDAITSCSYLLQIEYGSSEWGRLNIIPQ